MRRIGGFIINDGLNVNRLYGGIDFVDGGNERGLLTGRQSRERAVLCEKSIDVRTNGLKSQLEAGGKIGFSHFESFS